MIDRMAFLICVILFVVCCGVRGLHLSAMKLYSRGLGVHISVLVAL
jgi:hypothetical protein